MQSPQASMHSADMLMASRVEEAWRCKRDGRQRAASLEVTERQDELSDQFRT